MGLSGSGSYGLPLVVSAEQEEELPFLAVLSFRFLRKATGQNQAATDLPQPVRCFQVFLHPQTLNKGPLFSAIRTKAQDCIF
jgi:hypothetical protein